MELGKLNQNCKNCLRLMAEGKNEVESGFIFLSELIQFKDKHKAEDLLQKMSLNKKIHKIVKDVEESKYKIVVHDQQIALRLKDEIKEMKVYSLEHYLNKFLGLTKSNDNYYLLRIYFTHPQWITIFSVYDNVN